MEQGRRRRKLSVFSRSIFPVGRLRNRFMIWIKPDIEKLESIRERESLFG